MLKKNKKNIIIVCAMVAILLVGGISAYFTGTDEATNVWTVGEVDIDLIEEQYDATDESDREDITPNSEFAKDPVIKNTGTNDAFMFIKIAIPKANVIVANQDGTRQPSAMQELFAYQWNEGWTVVETQNSTDINGNSSDAYNTYVMAYTGNNGANKCAAVAKGNSTTVLLKNAATDVEHANSVGIITFKNVIENQGLEGTTLNIPVKAFGIQTTDLGTTNTTDPAAVWSILWNQSGNGEYEGEN